MDIALISAMITGGYEGNLKAAIQYDICFSNCIFYGINSYKTYEILE